MNKEGEALEKVLKLVGDERVDIPGVMLAVARCMLTQRDEQTYTCTDAKIRTGEPPVGEPPVTLTEWERGWNAACSELCNAIGNHSKPVPGRAPR